MNDDKPLREASAVIALVEEQAAVTVESAATARVRVTTGVETFEQIAHADLQSDVVAVTRVPINRTIDGPPPSIRTVGNVTIVPVFEEILVVETRLVLKEEIHIAKTATTETVDVPVILRREIASIERAETGYKTGGATDCNPENGGRPGVSLPGGTE